MRPATHRIKKDVKPWPGKRFVMDHETPTSIVGYVLRTEYDRLGPYAYRKDELELLA